MCYCCCYSHGIFQNPDSINIQYKYNISVNDNGQQGPSVMPLCWWFAINHLKFIRRGYAAVGFLYISQASDEIGYSFVSFPATRSPWLSIRHLYRNTRGWAHSAWYKIEWQLSEWLNYTMNQNPISPKKNPPVYYRVYQKTCKHYNSAAY